MSIEALVNTSETVPLNLNTLNERLKAYFHGDGAQDPSLEKDKEFYLENVNKSKELQALIAEYPDSFDLVFYTVGNRALSEEEIEIIVQNLRLREGEVRKNRRETEDRIRTNPEATAEEYDLGIFREQLETQVRDAVFELLKKGYRPWGSGFYDIAEGTQAITLESEGVDIDLIKKNLPEEVTVTQDGEQIVIVFAPQRGTSIQDLKLLWDTIVDLIPPNNGPKGNEINNGQQGAEFRKAQDGMRRSRQTLENAQ